VESESAVAAPAGEKRLREAMPEDVLQRRVHELETMVSEQRERLSKLSDANALETIQHEREVLAALLKEAEAQKEALVRNAEKDARAHERKLEQLRQQVKRFEQQLEETAGAAPRLTELEQALLFHERQSGEREQIVATREAELAAAQARVKELEARLTEAERVAARAATAEEALAAGEQRIEDEPGNVVDDLRAGIDRGTGDLSLGRIDRNGHVEPLRDCLDDGNNALYFFVGAHAGASGTRRLAANVENVGALADQPFSLFHRFIERGEPATIRETIRRDVEDRHDERPVEPDRAS